MSPVDSDINETQQSQFAKNYLHNMYKIVENEDGSTGVYSSKTGELICSVNSKKNPVGIGHRIQRSDNPAVSSPTTLQMGLTRSKLNSGKKCSESLELANCVKIEVSPIMKEYADDESSSDFPPLPSDDQDSTVGDFSDDCISQEEFLQCLGLVSTRRLEKNSCEDLRKNFPLRVISKTVPECARNAELQVKILEDVEICSPLGIRVIQSSPHHELDENAVMMCISKYERCCQFSVSSVYYGNVPQLRNRELLLKYPVTYRPLKTWRSDTFLYSFTKKQRLERLKSLKTGLNKRGRRLKRLCQEVSVNITRLSPKEIKSWVKRKAKPSASSCASRQNNSHSATNDVKLPVTLNGGSFKNANASLKHSMSLLRMNDISVKSKNHTGMLENGLPSIGPVQSGFTSVKRSSPVKLYLQNGKPRLKTPVKVQRNSILDNDTDSNDDIQVVFMKRPSVKSDHSAASCLKNTKKSSSPFMKCSVPLQDVSKQIDKVGGKCFVKGTSIKACGIESENKGSRENSVLLNNNLINSNCVTSNLLDHAYHRNHPLGNSTRQATRVSGRNSAAVSMKNIVGEPHHQDIENIRKIAIPRLAATLPGTKLRYSSLFVKKVDPPRLPGLKYTRSPPSVLMRNNSSLHLQPHKISPVSVLKVPQKTCSVTLKPNVKQMKRSIQVIDITEDSPQENLSPVKNKPNALKWMFRCYGCGYRSMYFTQLDLDDQVTKHMIQFHSVADPKSFLTSYLNTEESAIVTEAFPGYKNMSMQ